VTVVRVVVGLLIDCSERRASCFSRSLPLANTHKHVDRGVCTMFTFIGRLKMLIFLCDSLQNTTDHERVAEMDAPMEEDAPTTDTPAPALAAPQERKRPRLDLNVNARERKRGKSMFGLVLGTLNKAKNEDKARSASEAVRVALSPLLGNISVKDALTMIILRLKSGRKLKRDYKIN
jgi:hypothetical protein